MGLLAKLLFIVVVVVGFSSVQAQEKLEETMSSAVPSSTGGKGSPEAPRAEGQASASDASSNSGSNSNGVKKKRKGKIPREKEAEGTQAPNRFDTDTIIKSKYKLPNGQPLEVDTE